MVRAAAGALSHMNGNIKIRAPIPSPWAVFLSWITKEAAVRPRYTGKGTIYLEPSMGGYHIFEARNYRWILEPGAFWASEGEVRLGLHRESMWTSLWAGDGLIKYQTTATGDGRIVINAPGPVEEIDVEDEEIVVQGRLVLGRTDGLTYRSRRPTSLFESFFSGEPRVRKYSGTGKALVCWTPYWNQFMYDRMLRNMEED